MGFTLKTQSKDLASANHPHLHRWHSFPQWATYPATAHIWSRSARGDCSTGSSDRAYNGT